MSRRSPFPAVGFAQVACVLAAPLVLLVACNKESVTEPPVITERASYIAQPPPGDMAVGAEVAFDPRGNNMAAANFPQRVADARGSYGSPFSESNRPLGRVCKILNPQRWDRSGLAAPYLGTSLDSVTCETAIYCDLARQLEHASPGPGFRRAVELGISAVRLGEDGDCQRAKELLRTAVTSLDGGNRAVPAISLDSLDPSISEGPRLGEQSATSESPMSTARGLSAPAPTASAVAIKVPISSGTARVTSVVPIETRTVGDRVLENFDSTIIEAENGAIPLHAGHVFLVEESPWQELQSRPNPQFGATHSGLSRIQMMDLSRQELDRHQLKIMELLAQAGVGIARDFYTYDALRFVVQRQPDSYDFSWFDFTVENAKKLGIEVIGRVTLHTDPLEYGMPRDWSAYTEYLAAVLKRYAGRVNYWQPIKEPEPGPRNRPVDDAGLTPDDVAQVLTEFRHIADRVAPGARIYFPGFGPLGKQAPDSVAQYMKAMLVKRKSEGPRIDVLGVDAYINDVGDIVKTRRAQIPQYTGLRIPIWVAQIGAPASPMRRIAFLGGGSEELQCHFLAQSFARSFQAGATKVFWGEFLDKSQLMQRQGPDPFDSTGLIEVPTWRLKPAYFTYRLIAAALYGFTDSKMMQPEIYTFFFDHRGPVHLVFPTDG